MYRNTTIRIAAVRDIFIRHTALILSTMVLAFLNIAHTALADSLNAAAACANAVPVELDTTYRGYGNEYDAPHIVRMGVESTGILVLDLNSSDPGGAEARLSQFKCRGSVGSGHVTTIERAVDRLVLAVRRPGEYYFLLGTRDPGRKLEEYQLRSRFVTASLYEDEMVPDPKLAELTGLDGFTVVRTHFLMTDFSEKVGEDPTDPGEDGLRVGFSDPGYRLLSLASVQTTGSAVSEEEVGEDPTDPGEDGLKYGSLTGLGSWVLTQGFQGADIFPEPQARTIERLLWPDKRELLAKVRRAGSSEIGFRTDSFCPRDGRDDHGDTLRCSTPIVPNHSLRGEISNDWNDDQDTFSFTLSELEAVRIEVEGDFEPTVSVYDGFGQRLERQVGGLATTLVPGTYFVRIVAGAGAGGAYQLGLKVQEW